LDYEDEVLAICWSKDLSYPNVIFEISLATGYRGEGIGDLVEILLGSQMSK